MQILFLVTALATYTGAAKTNNLIKCNCTSILMPDSTIARLQGLLKNVSEDERVALDVSTIVANISVTLDLTDDNESTDVLPQITRLVATLLENTDSFNLATTVETLQRLQPILSAARSNGRVSPRIISVLQIAMNLFLRVSSNLLGGPLAVSDGELTVGGESVDEDSISKFLYNQRLQRLIGIITRLLRNILNISSPENVISMIEDVGPLLESLLESVDGGLENVLTTLLGQLSGFIERPPGIGSNTQNRLMEPAGNLCTVPTLNDGFITVPITQTISIRDLNSTLNARRATLARSGDPNVPENISNMRKIQEILNDVAARRKITSDQAKQLVPLMSALELSQTASVRPIKTNINLQSGSYVDSAPWISAVNLMPAIQKDLQDSLSMLTNTSGTPEAQRIIKHLRTAVNGLAGCSNPSASMVRTLLLAYQLLQATNSTASRSRADSSQNNLVPVVLKSITTIAPTQRGISPAVALLTTFMDSLYRRNQLTLDGVIANLKKMLNDGRLTRQSLLDVLVETLGRIPNLPPNISTALNDFLEQLTNYAEDRGNEQELSSSLKQLQEVIYSSTASQRHDFVGAFQWLLNVLRSIYNGDSILEALLKPIERRSVAPVSVQTGGDCDPLSLFGRLTCPLLNLIDDRSRGHLNGLSSFLRVLLGALV